MKRSVGVSLAAALLFGATYAGAQAVDFDQGIDVPAIVDQMKEDVKAAHVDDGAEYGALFDRETRDCTHISFRPDDPLVSERVYLESRIYRERCYYEPDHPRNPRPRLRDWDRPPRDSYMKKGRRCYEEWVRTERRRVRIEINGRGEMFPWERDVFEVCLQGDWLTAHTVDASHKYDLDVPGWHGDLIEAHAIRKTRSQPDPNGIRQKSFRFDKDAGNFLLELTDRWIEYYAGETVELRIVLKRHHRNWFDATVLDKKIKLPAAELYTVNFADHVSELTGDLKKGKRYYVKWRFKRIGNISKDDWQKYRETDKANFDADTVEAPPQEPEDDPWEDHSTLQVRAAP